MVIPVTGSRIVNCNYFVMSDLKSKIQNILNKPFQMESGNVYVIGYANGVYFIEDTKTGGVISSLLFDSRGATCLKKTDQSKNNFFSWKELEALIKYKPVVV
jgi:hypothetical protein